MGNRTLLVGEELSESRRLRDSLERRVDGENPCDIDDLYEVTQRPETLETLLRLRLYDQFLHPGVDQHVIDLLFDYLRSQGVIDPSAVTTGEQMEAIQSLFDSLDGYEETLPPHAKDPYIGYLLGNFSDAEMIIAVLNERGYLPIDDLRGIIADALNHPKPLATGVL